MALGAPKNMTTRELGDDQQLLALFGALHLAQEMVDTRAAAENKKTITAFQEAIGEMKSHSDALMQENAELRKRLYTLECQNKELKALRQAEKQAIEEHFEERIATLKRAGEEFISGSRIDVSWVSGAPLTPRTRSYYIEEAAERDRQLDEYAAIIKLT